MTVARHARAVEHRLAGESVRLAGIGAAPRIELRLGQDLLAGDEASVTASGDGAIDWLEPIEPFARPVPSTVGPGRLRWFLDGTQMTLPAFLCEDVPIVLSLAGAAVLERHDSRDLRIAPRLCELRRAWLVPRELLPAASLATLEEMASASEVAVVDILAERRPFEGGGAAQSLDYASLELLALRASRRLRSDLERVVLQRWWSARQSEEDWLVLDGALRVPMRQVVGVVKDVQRQYVGGAEARALVRLPEGHRSPAFAISDRGVREPYTLWFLRLRDAQGLDPRFGLVRVELAGRITDAGMIDALSGWLLRERAPRPTSDARWPTLLYPMHYLERILKRLVDRSLGPWP